MSKVQGLKINIVQENIFVVFLLSLFVLFFFLINYLVFVFLSFSFFHANIYTEDCILNFCTKLQYVKSPGTKD